MILTKRRGTNSMVLAVEFKAVITLGQVCGQNALCLNKPKLLSLVLITFVNNFQFNLVVMFVFFANNSLVINSI
jgi:hypothetical protein